jgi:hypothetical protein
METSTKVESSELVSPFDVFENQAQMVNEAIGIINQKLKEELLKGIPGSEGSVKIYLQGCTQSTLLEVVYRLRKAGWDVIYSEVRGSPYVKVGIFGC